MIWFKGMKTTTMLTYTVVFEPAEEGGYIASVPSLPGCMSQGETFEEVKRNIHEAIEGYLLVLTEHGDEIPRESPDRIIGAVTTIAPAFL